MGYTENDGSVRIDRFKEHGKWYDTYAIDMSKYWNDRIDGRINLIHDALREAIADDSRFGPNWVDGWLRQGGFIVCLEPYHKQSHPITLKAFRSDD